jgi:hypothetical protein
VRSRKSLSVEGYGLPQLSRLMLISAGAGLLVVAALSRLNMRCDCGGEINFSCSDTRFISCYSQIYSDLAGAAFASFMARSEVFVILILVGAALALYGLGRAKGLFVTSGR